MRHIKRTGIYRMISPTGKIYIGQSSDITNRKSRYKTLTCKNQRKLYNSLLKYGFEAHDFTVIQYFKGDTIQAKLDYFEDYYMKQYVELGHELLNLREAGSYGKHPLESRTRNSLSHKGKVPWNKGSKGLQTAWNKGSHIPRKIYKFKKNGEVITVDDLKVYCKDNGVNYTMMINLHNAYRFYKDHAYKGYERI